LPELGDLKKFLFDHEDLLRKYDRAFRAVGVGIPRNISFVDVLNDPYFEELYEKAAAKVY
jgi:hypothetical protein